MERGRGGKRKGGGDHLPYFSPTGFCLKYHPAATSHQLQLSRQCNRRLITNDTTLTMFTVIRVSMRTLHQCRWNIDQTSVNHQLSITSTSLLTSSSLLDTQSWSRVQSRRSSPSWRRWWACCRVWGRDVPRVCRGRTDSLGSTDSWRTVLQAQSVSAGSLARPPVTTSTTSTTP